VDKNPYYKSKSCKRHKKMLSTKKMHKIKTEMPLRKNHPLLHILTKKPHL